ncbi:MAG TPA: hypothetical protein VFL93_06445 [Longimicrobiaceae bacterium]|nr:hypothetical protein [Longimicrobiaceae bacterium]
MKLLVLLAGALLVVGAILDALWTTIWIDGHAGPIAGRFTSGLRRVTFVLFRRNHQVLSVTGPLVLVFSMLLWVGMLWAGWVVVFSADPTSLVHTGSRVPAGLADRIYFIGASLFTLGSADFSPQGPAWEIITAVANMSGLFLVTLAITYMLLVLRAASAKRSFASQVSALGRSGEEFVVQAWDGASFRRVELLLVSLVEQLGQVTAQNQAFPMLHYYHAARKKLAMAPAVAIFAEALVLLECGVAEGVRPSPSVLRVAQQIVRDYLDTLRSAYISPARDLPPSPDLGRLRSAGIPVVPDERFAAAIASMEERRRLLLDGVRDEAWEWPGPGSS